MIYFDLDNTLIDYNSSERKAIEFIFKEKYGLVLNNNQTDYWSKISRKYFDYYLSKQITFEEQGKNRFIKMLSYCGYVVNVKADDKYLNGETGKFELSQANPLVYVHGGYFELGPKIGKFGWSVEKNRMRTKEKA